MRLLAMLIFLAGFTATPTQAEYWREPIDNTVCSNGLTCARIAQIAAYGTKIRFGPCVYQRTSSTGVLYGAKCLGWTGVNFVRYGYAALYCESGEIKSTNGCIKAPVPDQDPACEVRAANPVDTSSGMKLDQAMDFATAGPLPLKFERHYRSQTNTLDGKYKTNRLGTGWRSNFDSSAFVSPTTTHPTSSLRFLLPDGTFYAFKKSGSTFVQRYYSWSSKAWVTASVSRSASAAWVSTTQRYELTTPDNTVWSYNTEGQLRSITYGSGYAQTLEYDSSGNNTLVTDSFGRTLSFTYRSNGLLQSMTAPDGQTYRYDFLSRYSESYGASLGVDEIAAEFFALSSVTYPDETPSDASDNPTIEYHYENDDYPFALTGKTNANGVRFSTYTYDANGRVTRSEHSSGTDAYDFSYDDTAYTTTLTNPLGKTSVYHFEKDVQSLNRLKRIEGKPSTNCAASDGYVAYNSSNFVTQKTDAEGHVTQYTRDSRGNPTKIIEAYGTGDQRTTTITWHASFNKPTLIVEPGRTISLAYDSFGRLLTRTETDTTTHTVPYSTSGEARTWSYGYSANGLLLSVDGPLPGTIDTTSYTYDSKGYLSTITDEIGLVTTVASVTANGYPSTVVDPNGIFWRLTYDARNRLTSVTADEGGEAEATTSLTHDADGRVTRMTAGDGSYLQYTYDDVGRVVLITNSLGEDIAFTYDAMGNATSAQVKSGSTITRSVTFAFDELGRLMRRLGSIGQTTSFAYNRVDDVTLITDPRGETYGYAYDALNRVIRETDQEEAQRSFSLDARDQPVSHTDPLSVTTSYVRNGFGEIIQESSPDIGSIVYRRNAVGAVTEMIDAKGESTTYTYDNAGRLTAKHFVTAPLQDVAYTYDDSSASNFGKGKLTHLSDASGSTALTWTRRGDLASLSSAIGSQTYTTSFSYDLGGRISTITYPSGREVSFTRDAQGQVTAVATRADAAAASSAVLQSIAWQPYGPFSVATLSSGLTLDHGFSLDQELTSITLFDGATSLLHRTFSRSDLINITGIDDPVNAGNQTFAYTPSNRLSIATGEWGSESYSYDPAGNRLSLEKIVNGTATTMSYAYSPLTNRLSSVSLNGEPSRTFTHDAAGNIIEDVRGGHVYGYSYDAAGHLASVTKDGLLWASYLYNSFDQLASRELTAATATPATSHYLYDAQGHLIAEADGSSGAILREYIWLDDMPIAVIDTVADGAPLYHVITDHLYRPIAMYDSTGTQVWSAVWEPFGALHSVSGALALDARFPGQWYQLETGLHYNWHRHYDPTLGRYTQPDPLGLEAGANRFTYALGNPIMNIDPDGQFILPMIAGGLIAGGIDAAAQYLLTGCIDLWQVGAAAAAGAVGGGAFANAFKHSSKAVSWWNSAQNYKAVSKRVRRVRDLTGDQELHHWFFPNNGWGSSVPNWIKNHPANLHTMETASHIALHNGKLGILGSLNYGLPGWLASTIGFAGGNGLGNALKPDCACKN